MKKFFSFFCSAIALGISSDAVFGAVRDENALNRQSGTTQVQQASFNSSRTSDSSRVRNVSSRTSTTSNSSQTARYSSTVTARPSFNQGSTTTLPQKTISRTGVTARTATAPVSKSNVVSRAATTTSTASITTETRTGAEYERCKNAYFTCMDQFCKLKSDDYRRCSCSNRVNDLAQQRKTLQDAGTQITAFNENLDVVGMTAEQATAMRTESEGEAALSSDASASKALLEAIMNSIRGKDAFVGGKYTDLNSINLAFDTANAFGTFDAGQAIAAYNGQELYSAVYPQCREAVAADCNDASLQRAITAYLMAIEQDCNTVQTAIESKQREMKSAVRESSAMLDLARVENRKNHNSSDFTTCLNAVEAAILSEEVCGAGYKKCLDNGEFIDVSTGKPIAGVERFYELEQLLTFADGVEAADQKLSKISSNKTFVKNFENRVKKFAEPALDKCTEQADEVWAEYLDKALLDIFYAQKSKVAEIKQGCFDFISSCYENTDASLTAAMKELMGDPSIVLQPDKITLTGDLCKDYINSCNLMFDNNIIEDYVNNRQETDVLSACRAAAKQCLDKFGGTNYENFYYPYSGLFNTGSALNWFTLYEYTLSEDGDLIKTSEEPVSECAKQLQDIPSCSSSDILEKAFGGFDVITASKVAGEASTIYYLDPNGEYNGSALGKNKKYGVLNTELSDPSATVKGVYVLNHRTPRPTGVATETYNQIVDILSTQCENVQGRFVEIQFIKEGLYLEENLCTSNFDGSLEYGGGDGFNPNLVEIYGIGNGEDMCPRDYDLNVDTQSWGACLCWENGGRRSKWGKSAKCVSGLPVTKEDAQDRYCSQISATLQITTKQTTADSWCTQTLTSDFGQICPLNGTIRDKYCVTATGEELKNLPESTSY